MQQAEPAVGMLGPAAHLRRDLLALGAGAHRSRPFRPTEPRTGRLRDGGAVRSSAGQGAARRSHSAAAITTAMPTTAPIAVSSTRASSVGPTGWGWASWTMSRASGVMNSSAKA